MKHDELLSHASELRRQVNRAGIPHMSIEVHNEPPSMKGSPISDTALHFEVLINSLIATYSSSEDSTAISILSYITENLISLMEMSADIAMTNRGLSQEDIEKRIEEMTHHEIPDIFKQAFGEENNE